jgi:uncharacterized integral membrane protein
MIVVYLLIAMLGAAVAFFTLQNPQPMVVNFFRWRSAELPLSLLMLISALTGVLLSALSAFAQQLQLHRRIRHLERRLLREERLAESELLTHSPMRAERPSERTPEHMGI